MRNAGFILILLVLIFTALMNGSLLCILAVLLVLTALLISFILTRIAIREMKLEIAAKEILSKKEETEIKISLLGQSRIPTGPVCFVFEESNRLTGENRQRKLCLKQESLSFSDCFCGCIDLKLRDIRVYDWFGLMPAGRLLDISRLLMVMPDTFPLVFQSDPAMTMSVDAQEYSQDKKGTDRSETFQIRDYVPGDLLSSVHWKLSSRMDHLVVKDASLPIDQSLLLVWDRNYSKDRDPACQDALCEAVTSMSQACLDAGMSFRILWNEETLRYADVTSPDSLVETVGMLMKAEGKGQDVCSLYEKVYEGMRPGRVLYFCDHVNEEGTGCFGTDHLTILCCLPDHAAGTGFTEGQFLFTPGKLEEQFQNLLIL